MNDKGGRMYRDNIPQRECPQKAPSQEIRALAARVRMNADRRVGKPTPAWIVALAKKDGMSKS